MTDEPPPRDATLLFALCVAALAFAVAFVWPLFTPEAVAWYYPTEHRWELAVKPSGLAMDFYGRVLQGAIAWSLAFLVAMLVGRRARPPRRLAAIAVGWALAATAFAMLYFAWTLHYRVPVPPPQPAWYHPR
jgi:MFS family permease